MKKFEVSLDDNGSVVSFGSPDEDSPITRYDIYRACKEIVLIVEQDMLVDNLMRSLVLALTPPNPEAEAKARMAESLKERKDVH